MAQVSMIVWNEFTNDARVLKEAETLCAGGHEVVIHALHKPGTTKERELLPCGASVIRVARSPLWRSGENGRFQLRDSPGQTDNAHKVEGLLSPMGGRLRILARLWTHIRLLIHMSRCRADVIHSHDVNTLPTAWLASRFSGAKLVYDAHEISTSREGYLSFRRLVAVIEKALMPRADGSITTTEARAKFFARAYGIDRPVVLQNRPRRQQVRQSNRIRDELSLDKPWPIILYQGGVQQGRGLERLARVAADVPNAYFVFIGGGRLDGSLRRIVEELQLEQRVRFIPTVALAELPSYTASADIGVQPIENTCLNHYTTDSNKLFEYVQAGLPVVASDLPEIRRVVRAHDLGLLVRPGDSASLTEALRVLVTDESKRKYHAAQSRKAAAVLNWESQEEELLALYDRVLSNSALV